MSARVRTAVAARTRYAALYRRFEPFTMCPRWAYVANLVLVDRYSGAAGAVVECGTWKGGMIAGIATVLGHDREYFLFDSFEGLPPAKEIDGPAAIAYQADTAGPEYHDNCRASEEDARRAMALAGARATITKGWFRDTLPRASFPNGIAVLRMDADWYDSTLEVLDNLFDKVTPGGVVIIDDYYTWDGCSRAVHDFLSKEKRPERIHEFRGVSYIVRS